MDLAHWLRVPQWVVYILVALVMLNLLVRMGKK